MQIAKQKFLHSTQPFPVSAAEERENQILSGYGQNFNYRSITVSSVLANAPSSSLLLLQLKKSHFISLNNPCDCAHSLAKSIPYHDDESSGSAHFILIIQRQDFM